MSARPSIESLENRTLMSISASHVGTYDSGLGEGAAEIVAFDNQSSRMFVVNATTDTVDILNVSPAGVPTLHETIDTSAFGSPNSVAAKNGLIAVAVQAPDKVSNGFVLFYNADGDLLNSVQVGSLPDMVTFTPDGSKVLVANEGEPNDDYSIDPEGSISIIDLSKGVEKLNKGRVRTADFTKFNGRKDKLIEAGVRIFGPGSSVAQDLEPEYIAIAPDGKTAYVTLQENNAVAVVHIDTAQVKEILPLGFKDWSSGDNVLDASDRDEMINLQNWPVLGMYQPDTISTYTVGGQTYFVTANEGDVRQWGDFDEEARVNGLTLDPDAFPNAEELQDNENLGRLKVTNTLGDTDGDGDYDQLYAFGARPFTIWDAEGNLVFDSAGLLEQITAELVPEIFNSEGDADGFDTRSDDKGPEPEALTIGQINGRYYAFVGLERTGGILVFDITDPTSPSFVQYLQNAGDVSPEGLAFISATDSPTGQALLAVANEISGTTTLYQITEQP